MREGIITAIITHSAVFSAVSLHDPCLQGMCGGLLQPLLHLPALADDTSLSRCLWWPAGNCHLCTLVTSKNTSHLSLAPLAQIKQHSCDPCCRQSLWGHRQGSKSRVLEAGMLQLPQPHCSLTPDLCLRSSFGLERACCVSWPWLCSV